MVLIWPRQELFGIALNALPNRIVLNKNADNHISRKELNRINLSTTFILFNGFKMNLFLTEINMGLNRIQVRDENI